jgi:hypothetical protein
MDYSIYHQLMGNNPFKQETQILQEEDIVASSIQKLVAEILEDIGDIFYRERLSIHESNMILVVLEDKIKKELRQKNNKED